MLNVETFLPTYPSPDDKDIQKKIFERKEFNQLQLQKKEEIPTESGTLLNHQKIISRLLSPHTDINELLLFHGLGTGKCVLPETIIHTSSKGKNYTAQQLWDIFYNKKEATYDAYTKGLWSKPIIPLSTLSYNEDTGKIVTGNVLRLFKQYIHENIVHIVLENDREIRITQSHKLMCNGEWTTNYKIGDHVFCYLKSASKIKNISHSFYSGYVYDFEIEKYHNYFANDILAHNTCASVAVAENFFSERKTKALVLTKGTSIISNFIDEIAKKCTVGKYLPEYARTQRIRKGKIRKLVRESYELRTIGTFIRDLPSLGSPNFDREVKERYSNRVIIIDEAQNLRLREGKKEESVIYNTIHKFLHTVENPTILLLSATPMWDKTNEIATLMNLILPMSQQFPIEKEFENEFLDSEGKLKSSKIEKFTSIVNGRVSYVRPIQTTAKIIAKGQSAPWLKYMKIWPDVMSNFQANILRKAKDDVKVETIKFKKEGKKDVVREIRGGTFHEFTRQASNFVYPDGTYGKDGYNKYIIKDSYIASEYSSDIKNNLQKYSSKFYFIIQDILSHPDSLIFVYTDFVRNGGANLFAAILKLFGFTKASGRETTPGKRYALITSVSVTETQFEKIKSVFNSKENRNGEKIQVFIGSRKIGLGITLKRVRRVHILSPHWNNPTMEQAIGRALRLDSHIDMPKDTTVEIFRHAAVEKDFGIVTTDIKLYSLAEKKDISDHTIYRQLKRASIDCPLAYSRNVLSTDKEGSMQCDYEKCNYECTSVKPITTTGVYKYKPAFINEESYNIFYSTPEVEEIAQKIVTLFGKIFYIKTENLMSYLKEHSPFLVLKSVLEIISNRIPILNKFGSLNYLKEDKDILFLDDRAYPLQSSFGAAYYVQNPILKLVTELKDYVNILDMQHDILKLRSCFSSKNIEKFIENLSVTTQIVLLEYAYSLLSSPKKSVSKKVRNAAEKIVEVLGNELYTTSKGTVHRMKIEQFKGSSHSVARAKTKSTGELRCYNQEQGAWRYCTEDEEEEILKLIKEKTEEIDEFENNPYGMFGTISSKDGKFRVKIKEHAGKRKKTGQVCGSGWLNKNRLVNILLDIGYIPKTINPKYNNKTIKEMKDILSRSKNENVKVGMGNATLENLKIRATILTSNIETLCEWLKEWMQKNKLLKKV